MKRFCILLTAIILLSTGCGIKTLVTSKFVSNNNWPRKRVMVMPASDLTGVAFRESRDTIHEKLISILQKTECFKLCPPNEIKTYYSFTPGELINPELLREAKERGINAIIFETLNPVEIKSGKSGIWPLRKKAWICTVSMNVDIVDITSETLFASKEIADTITLLIEETEIEIQNGGPKQVEKKALMECLPKILREAAQVACFSINQRVWTGKIVSINAKEIIINAGNDVGLRPGIVLEVLSRGKSITSFHKKSYHLPGPRVGEIKIVSVKQNHSFAEPLEAGDLKPGQIIRIKD